MTGVIRTRHDVQLLEQDYEWMHGLNTVRVHLATLPVTPCAFLAHLLATSLASETSARVDMPRGANVEPERNWLRRRLFWRVLILRGTDDSKEALGYYSPL